MDTSRKIATEAAQSLLTLHHQYIQKIMGQWAGQVKNSFSKVPFEETTAHQAESAKTASDEMAQHLHNTRSVLKQSHEKIIKSVKTHLKTPQ